MQSEANWMVLMHADVKAAEATEVALPNELRINHLNTHDMPITKDMDEAKAEPQMHSFSDTPSNSCINLTLIGRGR